MDDTAMVNVGHVAMMIDEYVVCIIKDAR